MEYNDNLKIETEVTARVDNSFRQPMEFLAIENNAIYLKYLGQLLEGRITSVPLEVWAEDWLLVTIPEGLTLQDII